MIDNYEWDELDLLFQRAKNKLINPNESLTSRKEFFDLLNQIFLTLEVEFYLTQESRYLFDNKNINKVVPEDNIIIFENDFIKLSQNLDILLEHGIKPVIMKHEFWCLKKNENIVNIKLSSINPLDFKNKLKKIEHNGKEFFVHKSKKNISFLSKPKKNYLNSFILLFKNLKQNYISFDEFLNLYIESKNSMSWSLREDHLALVTDFSKYKKIGEIINYLNSINLDSVLKNVIETDLSEQFEEPIHANKKFWKSGNNFFVFPMIYEFKKNVVPYKNANKYIGEKNKYTLYSKAYYENLESMSDDEIKIFLKSNPIEIKEGAIVSGKHRTFAMIGRIVKNKSYLKMKVKYV
jgi:hypothetical protein